MVWTVSHTHSEGACFPFKCYCLSVLAVVSPGVVLLPFLLPFSLEDTYIKHKAHLQGFLGPYPKTYDHFVDYFQKFMVKIFQSIFNPPHGGIYICILLKNYFIEERQKKQLKKEWKSIG